MKNALLTRRFFAIVMSMSILTGINSGTEDLSKPIVSDATLFLEKNGQVAVEAEHFFEQTRTDKRAFYLTTSEKTPEFDMDGDPPHVGGASNGAYLEILPDTRRNHDEKLIAGENFSEEPGKLAIVHYKVHITNPGRYYVWVRAQSTGTEDNGLHVGIDGTWPESGRRLQWCVGKKTWRWDSMQRTKENHCGEPHKIFLDIENPGVHTIHFSMREDGFEFDKFLMVQDIDFARPEEIGPQFDSGDVKVPTFQFVKGPPIPETAEPVADPNSKPDRPKSPAKLEGAGKKI